MFSRGTILIGGLIFLAWDLLGAGSGSGSDLPHGRFPTGSTSYNQMVIHLYTNWYIFSFPIDYTLSLLFVY